MSITWVDASGELEGDRQLGERCCVDVIFGVSRCFAGVPLNASPEPIQWFDEGSWVWPRIVLLVPYFHVP